jgi:nicotinate-nucleotide adenylyltransferase
MRIGLLGGSFNPAHEGHRHISLIALKRLQLDQIWWLVTPGNPLKDTTVLQTIGERMAQARDIARSPRIVVTDFERHLSTPYTIDTVRFLQRRYPGTDFVWIVGADNLTGFHHWLGWSNLFRMLPILVVDRPECRNRALSSRTARRFADNQMPESRARSLPGSEAPAWIYLTAPLSDMSSTAIRQAQSKP